jgi:hypothetical protein
MWATAVSVVTYGSDAGGDEATLDRCRVTLREDRHEAGRLHRSTNT